MECERDQGRRFGRRAPAVTRAGMGQSGLGGLQHRLGVPLDPMDRREVGERGRQVRLVARFLEPSDGPRDLPPEHVGRRGPGVEQEPQHRLLQASALGEDAVVGRVERREQLRDRCFGSLDLAREEQGFVEVHQHARPVHVTLREERSRSLEEPGGGAHVAAGGRSAAGRGEVRAGPFPELGWSPDPPLRGR